MVKDLTLDEITWRFSMLNSFIEQNFVLDPVELLNDDKNTTYLVDLVCGSLVFLQKIGAIKIVLHKGRKLEGAVFTATRNQCVKTSWTEPDENYSYERPSEKVIPVPVLFDNSGNESFTHVSLLFDFPDTNIGHACERLVNYLRKGCKKDIHVINVVIFLQECVSEQAYGKCLRRVLTWAFVDNIWASSTQTPTEVDEIRELFLDQPSKHLYDPFMRTGLNLFYAMGKYHAQATNRFHYYSTMLCAGVLGLDTENIEFSDCQANWDPRDCDTIMVSPEFGMEITNEDGSIESVGSWSLDKVYNSLDIEGRRAILLLPASILTSNEKVAGLRHDITEANLLDAVVLLPANIFQNTTISTVLIFLKCGRKANENITFADFSYFISDSIDYDDDKSVIDIDQVKETFSKEDNRFIRKVSVEDIRKRDYEWYVPNYIDDAKDIPVGYRKVYLSDLVEPLDGDEYGTSLSGKVIMEDSLVMNPFMDYPSKDCALHVNIDDEDISETYTGSIFIIDFSTDGIKTYYYEMGDTLFRTVSVQKELYVYRINPEMIDVNYFRYLLYTIDKDSNGQLRAHGIKHWRHPHGYDQSLVIPLSIEEQKRLYEEAKFNVAIENARKQGLDKAIGSLKQEYMMEVRLRKHDMKPFLSQLDSQAKLISFYLNKIEGNESTVEAIRSKLEGISNSVSELRLHLNRLTEEDIYGSPELINPILILKEFVGTYTNYSIELNVDSIAFKEAKIETPEIYISRIDFSTLATTIIENAVSHAFVSANDNYKILITLSFNSEKELYTIDFKNNGNPMPLGMDKFRYGLKGEKGASSNGSGLGGYRVKSITRHFGGDYDVFCNRAQKFTTIRISFPKYRDHE